MRRVFSSPTFHRDRSASLPQSSITWAASLCLRHSKLPFSQTTQHHQQNSSEEPTAWVAGVIVSLRMLPTIIQAPHHDLGMLEGDQDGDIAAEITIAVMGGQEHRDRHQALWWALSLGPPVDAEKDTAAAISAYRQKFDSGMGEKLFQEYRSKEGTKPDDLFSYEYRSIVLAAIMMHVGAEIKQEHIEHLRELVPKIPSREGYQWPILGDDGFRGPGQRQFRAALDNYKSGTPRSFEQPSCHGCGKVAADIGKPLLRCAGCSIARGWFCDKVCPSTFQAGYERFLT